MEYQLKLFVVMTCFYYAMGGLDRLHRILENIPENITFWDKFIIWCITILCCVFVGFGILAIFM